MEGGNYINWNLEHFKTKEQILITKTPFRVGRAGNMDIICKSVNVSRNHADVLVYIDGTLHIKENKAVNGTYINQKPIRKDEIASINEGDEIGFGSHSGMILQNASGLYVYIAKKRFFQTITVDNFNVNDCPKLEISDQPEDVKGNVLPHIFYSGDYIPLLPIVMVENCNSASTSIENIVKQENADFLNLPAVLETPNVETKTEAGYLVDEDGCIIIDGNLDEVIIKKERISSNDDMLEDTIFQNMQKELEALDKYDNFIPTYCIDSDGEPSQNWDDIFNLMEHEKLPIANAIENDDSNTISTSTSVIATRSTNLENVKDRIRGKAPEKIPPVISPHFEKNLENKNKRKSPMSNNHAQQIKKVKTNNFYGSKVERDYQKAESVTEIRKRKLKEIAKKSQNEQIKCETKRHAAKVKVSDGRGKFLETLCSAPSTSKPRNSNINVPKKFSISTKLKISTLKESETTRKETSEPKQSTIGSNNAPLFPIVRVKKMDDEVCDKNVFWECRRALLNKDLEDSILEMLTWDVLWFSDRNYNDKVPSLTSQPLQRMNKFFANYAEYHNIVMPLLMVEVWNFLYKEVDFNFTNEPLIYFAIRNEAAQEKFIELDCLIHLPKEKVFKEGDVIVLRLYLENEKREAKPPTVAVLGYVAHVNKKNLVDRANASTSTNQTTTVIAKIMIQRLNGKINKSNDPRPCFQYITSFISSARTIRSIKCLEKSELCQHILRPTCNLYKVPRATRPQLYLKDKLNTQQLEAISEATHICLDNSPKIYLIHGPPGTGKTTVIVNIILSVIFDEKFKDKCILVTARTNAAVDELAMRIIAAKSQLPEKYRKMAGMVRIGPKNSVRAEVQDYLLCESAKRTLLKDLLKHEPIENKRKLEELKEKVNFWKHQKDHPDAKNKCKAATLEFERCFKEMLGPRYNELISKCADFMLKGARIICTTLSSCASINMERNFSGVPNRISCCIIDEATQSTEQETLIPLILGINKVVLVGDPKQLPAFSFAQESKEYGFGQSLFSRIDSNFKGVSQNPIKFLNTQYRMHPAICLFPNNEYYDGKLRNAPTLFNRKSPLNKLQPYLVFHFQGDTNNTEEYRNKSEILCVITLLEAIVTMIPTTCNFSIGVITPYNDQKQGILQNIKKKTYTSNVSITVDTVDSFQGRENDVIVLSCVRNHANNFLSDDQRLNVALTRAKFALYIIGSTNLFKSCLKFGKISRDANKRKLLKNFGTQMPVSVLSRMIFT